MCMYTLQDGDMLLHLTASDGHTNFVKYLLPTQTGINVNVKNKVSSCFLMMHVVYMHINMPTFS